MDRSAFLSIPTTILVMGLVLKSTQYSALLLIVGSCLLLCSFCYLVIRHQQPSTSSRKKSQQQEAFLIEQERYLLAKEAILDKARQRVLEKQAC